MLSSISNLSNASTAYAAQSALSQQPKIPTALESLGKKISVAATEDVYESADGSVATRNDIKSSEAREKAERIRQQLDAKANEKKPEKEETPDDKRFRELLHQFVGQVMFGQMLKSMRETQGKNPYFDGGRAEEIFQSQLDMVLTDQMSKSSSHSISEPMYKLMKAPKFSE